MNEMLAWVKYSWSKGFNLEGRARRREFWWNFLFYEVIAIALNICISIFGIILGAIAGPDAGAAISVVLQGLTTIISIVISIVIMLPLYVRRFHDIGMCGWIYLACIVGSFCCCIGTIVLLVLMCQDSKPDNQYGPNPKAFGGTLPNDGGYGNGGYNSGTYY